MKCINCVTGIALVSVLARCRTEVASVLSPDLSPAFLECPCIRKKAAQSCQLSRSQKNIVPQEKAQLLIVPIQVGVWPGLHSITIPKLISVI